MYKSFAITIRPRNGVVAGGTLEKAIIKKMEKYDFASIFSEKEEEARHLHCQIWVSKAVAIGTIKTAMVRISEREDPDWSDASKKVLRSGIKIAYSDWILDYCESNELKTDKSECLMHRVPPMTSSYYATEEEQEKIIEGSKSANQTYFKLKLALYTEEIYESFRVDPGKERDSHCWERLGNYLGYRMYVNDTFPIQKCPKQMNQFIKAFTKYVNKSGSCKEFLSENDLSQSKWSESEQVNLNKKTK